MPTPEACNAQDDDCDGEVDEALVEFCYEGPEGTARTGACTGGVTRCSDGEWGPCNGQVLPEAEGCNGADDDCDGTVDEGRDGAPLVTPCYGGAEGTEGVGPCIGGGAVCELGNPGACIGQVVPNTEACDMVDNDCDGETDEVAGGCGCEADAARECYAGPEGTAGVGECRGGQQVCAVEGSWGPCDGEALPADEACNGLDDDCDGATDEAVPGVGEPCETGVGACARGGLAVCRPVQRNVVCDAPVGEPAAEACNGLDDDCDGTSDEGLGLDEPCTVGVGGCRRDGVQVCAQGGVVCGAMVGAPVDEVCNGADDDCDGTSDEALVAACFTGPAGAEMPPCAPGEKTCAAGVWGDCLGQTLPAPEVCDLADNDCDGEVDERAGGLACECEPGDRRECYTGPPETEGVGDCDGGVQDCAADGSAWGPCVGQTLPGLERCDGGDEDCDDEVDEVGGEACSVGVGACRRAGELECEGDELVCDAEPAGPGLERCNGADDDCDGTLDEGFQVGAPCHVGVGQCRREAVLRCGPNGGTECPAQPRPPGVEVCDLVDNDCDGDVDEGTNPCDCPNAVGEPEVCNGIDDDCDGLVDDQAVGAMPLCEGDGDHRVACVAGACRLVDCEAQTYDANADATDGCERTCAAFGRLNTTVYNYANAEALRPPALVVPAAGLTQLAIADGGTLQLAQVTAAGRQNAPVVELNDSLWTDTGIAFDGRGLVFSGRLESRPNRGRVVGTRLPANLHETALDTFRGGHSLVVADGSAHVFAMQVSADGNTLRRLRFGVTGVPAFGVEEAVGAHDDYDGATAPAGFVAEERMGVIAARAEAQGGALLRAVAMDGGIAAVVGEVALPRRASGRVVTASQGDVVLAATFTPPDRIVVARLDLSALTFTVTADFEAGAVNSLALAWLGTGPVLYYVTPPIGWSMVLDAQGRAVSPPVSSYAVERKRAQYVDVAAAPPGDDGVYALLGQVVWAVENENGHIDTASIEVADLVCR